MNPQFSPLIELQKFDLRIAEIKEQQKHIPQRFDAAEAPLREAKRRLSEASTAVETFVKDRRSRERDLESHEAQTEKMKSRLTELKTNKEYQAHLFEIEIANKKKGEIEDQILALMEKIEQTQRTVKDAQSAATEAERAFGQERTALEALGSDLSAELTELEGKQRTAASSLEKGLLERYTKLKASRKDQALAAVRNGICCGCRLQVPPQLIAEVKRSNTLHTCPYCNRILYWEGPSSEDIKTSTDSLKATDAEVGETV